MLRIKMLFLFLFFVSFFSCDDDLRRFTVEINVQTEKIGNFNAKHDGSYFVVTGRSLNLETNTSTYKFYLKNNSDIITLPLNYSSIHDVLFTPTDNILLFVVDSDVGSTLVLYNISNNQSEECLKFPLPVSGLKWSPKNNYLVFTASVYPNMTMQETVDLNNQKANSGTDKMTYDNLFVYHWDTFENGEFNHVFYTKITGNFSNPFVYSFDSNPVDVMFPLDGNCPSKPFGGSEEYAISWDGDYIAYSTQTGPNQAWNLNVRVYLYSINENNTTPIPVDNIGGGGGRYMDPSFEPKDNWKYIAFQATVVANDESAQTFIAMYDRNANTSVLLNDDISDSVADFVWTSADASNIYTIVRRSGRQYVCAFDATTGNVSLEYPAYSISQFVVLDNKSLIYTRNTYSQTTNVYLCNGPDEEEVPLSTFNAGLFQTVHPLLAPQDFYHTGANNTTIHSFYFPPLGVDEETVASGALYPLILYVHGGPESAWTDQWSDRWNPQTLIHQGYAILATNFHGSDSYGQAFTDSIKKRWGSWPYEDVLTGLEAILQNKPYLDASRIAAMGASYGGFMINWLQASTSMFKALICHDGLFDIPSMYHETDELYFVEQEFGGLPFEDPDNDLYDKFSSSTYTTGNNYNTPELIFHGGRDLRVPRSQGIMAFQHLQEKGVPSRLVYFPSENHWVLNPYNSIRWHQEVLDWLHKYV